MNGSSNDNFAFGLERFRDLVARKTRETGYFDASAPITVSRAPGRLDLMGGIADYSGSLVLQYPIKEATFAAAQLSGDGLIRIESITDPDSLHAVTFKIAVSELEPRGRLGSVAAARSFFNKISKGRWAAYAAGTFPILAEARQTRFPSGIRILIWSDVPAGKGVSSSAALEVSVMKVVAALYGGNEPFTGRDLALLCQRVENEIVGAPCGIMDQMTSSCGVENGLTELLCQPAELLGTVGLPDDIEIWGIDSGIRHSVAGADYGTVRTAASMGYRMIADVAGLKIENRNKGRVRIDDPVWNGYLANIDTAEFDAKFSDHLPPSLKGDEFLARFGGISDLHSNVSPEREYPVHAATAHPVHENARVRRFADLLRAEVDAVDLNELGDLMYASHASYSNCGLGSDGTDQLVDLVKAAGADSGLLGAKITGGGSGGTVAILGKKGARSVVDRVAEKYHDLTGRIPYIFSGSSPGAFQFGLDIIEPQK